MRPIDADEIRKKAVPHTRGEHGYNANIRKWAVLVGDIDDAPTIDAVPVVRCKDCVLHGNCLTEDTFDLCRIENPFCCGGKRKDGDGNGVL